MAWTVDIMTSNLHWSSVLSTQQAKYMCLDLKHFTFLLSLTCTNTCYPHWFVPFMDCGTV
jgi:hypothetical protein